MNKLKEILAAVIVATFITAAQVKEVKDEVLADGVIDRDEANILFEMNDAVSGNTQNDPSWGDLFVESIAAHVLEDEESPGDIDEDEGKWLVAKIQGDGEIDDLEKRLLIEIDDKANSIEYPELEKLIELAK